MRLAPDQLVTTSQPGTPGFILSLAASSLHPCSTSVCFTAASGPLRKRCDTSYDRGSTSVARNPTVPHHGVTPAMHFVLSGQPRAPAAHPSQKSACPLSERGGEKGGGRPGSRPPRVGDMSAEAPRHAPGTATPGGAGGARQRPRARKGACPLSERAPLSEKCLSLF